MNKEKLSCWISESDHFKFKARVDFCVQFFLSFKICHCLIPFIRCSWGKPFLKKFLWIPLKGWLSKPCYRSKRWRDEPPAAWRSPPRRHKPCSISVLQLVPFVFCPARVRVSCETDRWPLCSRCCGSRCGCWTLSEQTIGKSLPFLKDMPCKPEDLHRESWPPPWPRAPSKDVVHLLLLSVLCLKPLVHSSVPSLRIVSLCDSLLWSPACHINTYLYLPCTLFFCIDSELLCPEFRCIFDRFCKSAKSSGVRLDGIPYFFGAFYRLWQLSAHKQNNQYSLLLLY